LFLFASTFPNLAGEVKRRPPCVTIGAMGTYLGFDPGGAGAFGWAVVSGLKWPLELSGRGVADHAEGAFGAAMDCAGTKIEAVGIDAPLFWVAAGDRRVDQIVRRAVTRLGCFGGTVQSVNSLRGACLIQGMLVGMMCQSKAGDQILLTESHPKALLWLLGKASGGRAVGEVALHDLNDYVVGGRVQGASDHERDAALGAVAAFAMKSRFTGWRDLSVSETNAMTPLSPPPGYWMPL